MATANFTMGRSRITRVMAELESTYGTTAGGSLTGGTDDVMIFNSPAPVEVGTTKIETDPHRGSFTRRTVSAFGENHLRVRLRARLSTSGTDADLTVNGFKGLAALISACGATIQAVDCNSIEIAPSTIAALQSCTIWVDEAGETWKIPGCVGNCTISGTNKSFIDVDFDMVGLYVAPVATGSNFSGWTGGTDRSKRFQNIGLTIDDGGGAYTPVISRFSHNFGVLTDMVENMNDANGIDAHFVADRKSTLDLTIAHDLYASAAITPHQWQSDWFADGSVLHDVAFAFSATTNKIAGSFPEAQLVRKTKSDTRNIYSLGLTYDLLHTSTDEGDWLYTLGSDA